ncbi:hypothetical protein FGE12_10940 [Aggregicoccus sp. 17bor-14]|uniref:hypothetical protein n=1 Tax=Myxococcaceae TaxID=31 RepID=UPI00129D0044|nr:MULTISPECIES: hypothetical protein [Myxococcaceae]MBF5042904.1 hypothetical protein [Simulacricoccus sp. 17bor-14]MRI88671.1 hypothetical protein [Aggregicoccus sp. 17bor-14]
MARISQDQTQERHAYVLELFREQPELSRADALAAYKARFGASLNPKTLNELREQAQAEAANGPTGASADDVVAALTRSADAGAASSSAASPAPAPKAPKAAKGAKVKNLFIDAAPEQLQFLEQIVGQLQEAGATNVRVDHATERWMVLAVETK